METIKMTVSWS